MASKSLPQHQLDNRSRQLNPQDDRYWQSRGQEERPADAQSPAPQDPPSKQPAESNPAK